MNKFSFLKNRSPKKEQCFAASIICHDAFINMSNTPQESSNIAQHVAIRLNSQQFVDVALHSYKHSTCKCQVKGFVCSLFPAQNQVIGDWNMTGMVANNFWLKTSIEIRWSWIQRRINALSIFISLVSDQLDFLAQTSTVCPYTYTWKVAKALQWISLGSWRTGRRKRAMFCGFYNMPWCLH